MKKTLIALAAVAVSTGAMAQATISGILDVNAVANNKTTATSATNAVTTKKTATNQANNGWATSELRIGGSEDLGGGLTASFQLNTGLANGASTLADRDRWLQLSGGFGSVRIGSLAPAPANGFNGFTGSRTTASAGSLYTPILGGSAEMGADFAAGSFERGLGRTIQYTSPSMNGFTVNVSYANSKADDSALGGKADAQQTGLSFAYAAGPLALGGGTNQRKVNTEAVAAVVGTCVVNNSNTTVGTTTILGPNGCKLPVAAKDEASHKGKLNWLGASYNLGVATVSAAHITRKDTSTDKAGVTTTGTDVKMNVLGLAVPMGATTIGASVYRGTNKMGSAATDDLKLTGHQLSVTYALSKRTQVYAVMGEAKSARKGGNTDGVTGKRTSNAIGLTHSF